MDLTDEKVLFATVARHLASQTSEQAVLQAVLDMAMDLLPDCDDAGILILSKRHKSETPAATSQRVHDSDAAQIAFGEGPCFDAALKQGSRNQVFRCADTHTDPRWPRYLARARELEIGSILGFQLFNHDQNFGALNLYSDHPGAFDAESESQGWVLASHAAVALTSARTSEQLHAALESSRTIGQATGIVRERYEMSEDQATSALLRISQDHNIKMAELARAIVAGGDLPT